MVRSEDGRISVLLADDHRLLGEALGMYLESGGGFQVSHAETLDGALSAMTEAKAAGRCFDFVLLDLEMPGMFGMAGLGKAVAAEAGPVVLFSGQVKAQGAMKAVEMGAAGYIPKTLSPQSVAAAIRLVVAGECYFPVADRLRHLAEPEPAKALTSREEQVLHGICDGATNRDIAALLGLSEIAVKMHVRSLCSKLGAANRTQAAIIGMGVGLV